MAEPVSSGAGPDERLDVLVAGYASLDYVYRASAPPAVGRTALLMGPVAVKPRFGGCGPTAARELARFGRRTGLVTWLGDDEGGRAYVRTLAAEGVDVRGVVVAPGEASPRCLLLYDPAGGATCYYHPGGSAALRLTDEGPALLASARLLALTVAPAALTTELLDARPAGMPVAWNVKADPDAYPSALRARLVREAAVVCLNRDELAFVAAGLSERSASLPAAAVLAAIRRASGGVVVVTAGGDGSTVAWPEGIATVPTRPVAVADPTGAGDVFFGALVGAWLGGADPVAAAQAATERVATVLRQRAAAEGGG